MNDLGAITVRNLKGEKTLEMQWSDGSIKTVTHYSLRLRCRCAYCNAAQVQTGQPVSVRQDVALLQIERVGGYGVRLFFDDGHSRGIYPWVYLRELAGGHTPP